MSLRNIANLLWNHPLNVQNGRFAAVGRFARWQLAQRLMPVPMAIPFINDSRLVLTRGLSGGTGNWYCGLHEHNDMGFALHMLRPGDLFGDIGANIGSYTILAAAGVGANVLSVEASPQTYERLMANVALNRVEHVVDAQCVGASSEEGELRFSTGLDAMNHVMTRDETGPAITVPVKPLDMIFGDRRPKLLKIDVEGHEGAVLQGATRVLSDPGLLAVIMETNGLSRHSSFTEDDLFALMEAKGFTPHQYDALNRTLSAGRTSFNTVFVRDLTAVQALCRSAPKYQLSNGMI